MTDINPTTQAVEPAPQSGEGTEQATPQQPASEQEPFDKDRAMATIQKLREIERARKAELKELEQLRAEQKKRVEAEMTETEKLRKQADELNAQNAKLVTDILRRDVIAETGIPAIFADRLKGATKEEMLADAAELKKALPTKQAPTLNSTNPSNAGAETEAQKRERLMGKNISPFDMNNIRERGGGVIFNSKTE